jgi:hypothetical protein
LYFRLGLKLRFLALLLWCFAVTGLAGYLAHDRPRWQQGIVLTLNLAAIAVPFVYYDRDTSVRQTSRYFQDVQKKNEELLRQKIRELESHTGRPYADLQAETRRWFGDKFGDKDPYFYLVDSQARLSPAAKAAVEAELAAGNLPLEIHYVQLNINSPSIYRVQLRDDFRLPHPALRLETRFTWERDLIDPASGHEIYAIFRRSTPATPLLCEHMRPIELAFHQAGIPVANQFAWGTERKLMFEARINVDKLKAMFPIAPPVTAERVEEFDGREHYDYAQIRCAEHHDTIQEYGGTRVFPE